MRIWGKVCDKQEGGKWCGKQPSCITGSPAPGRFVRPSDFSAWAWILDSSSLKHSVRLEAVMPISWYLPDSFSWCVLGERVSGRGGAQFPSAVITTGELFVASMLHRDLSQRDQAGGIKGCLTQVWYVPRCQACAAVSLNTASWLLWNGLDWHLLEGKGNCCGRRFPKEWAACPGNGWTRPCLR